MRNKTITRLIAVLVITVSALTLAACNGKKSARFYDYFGTEIVVDLSGAKLTQTVDGLNKLYAELDARFDAENKDSDLYRINAAAADEIITVAADTYELLKLSKEAYARTDGAFNIATYGLSKLWKFNSDSYSPYITDYTLPSESDVADALSHANLDNLVLLENNKVKKLDGGLTVGLGAIAKGYAGDRAYSDGVLKEGQTGILNVGGTIFTVGNKNFAIGIGNPRDSRFEYFAKLTLKGNDVVCTSGDYFRFYTVGDKKYCHIFGTNGYPVDNDIISVTVVAADGAATGATCDILSTAVFALGKEKGELLAREYGVGLVIIYDDKTFDVVNLADGIFTLKDTEYSQNV